MSFSALTITCLGPVLDIRVGGESIAPKRSRKAKWLLALLAARHRREVSREWIAARLWPDSDPVSGAHNLRQTLSDLRQALGGAADRIVSDGRNLRLDVESADIDVVRFDNAIAKGDREYTSSDPSSRGEFTKLESLRIAVELYAGPFLDGADELWIIAEREPRHLAVLKSLDKLATAAGEADDLPAAIGLLRRAVALSPLDEPVLRNLLLALQRSGDHSGMVEALRSFERLIAREDPFARPSAETMELLRETRATLPKPERPRLDLPERPPLPIPLTELIGRSEAVVEVAQMLSRKRLVTLTGPGGVGKTRLALAVAHRIEDSYYNGAVFVDLAIVGDPDFIPTAVASSLMLVDALGRISASTVIENLRDARLLLLLDNCEHIVDRVAEFVEMLLARCPSVRVLATSREPLRVAGEKVSLVSTLGFPSQKESNAELLAEYPAVRLFVDRAVDAADQFRLSAANAGAVATICRSLDGIPLALELAAVMTSSMDAHAIADSLDDRFQWLTHGSRTALPRHQTLQGVVDWGYDLLTEGERIVLRRLSVFNGDWTVDDAVVVTLDSQEESHASRHSVMGNWLAKLVRKSFVVHDVSKCRYRLLETIRHYALERLRVTGEDVAIRDRHMRHFLLGLEAATGWRAASLIPDLANIRSAMDWSVEHSAPDFAVKYCSYIAWFAGSGYILAEGRGRFEALLRRSDFQEPSLHRARALQMAGWFSTKQADVPAARAFFSDGQSVCVSIGERDFLRSILVGRVETEQVAGDIRSALRYALECMDLIPETDEESYRHITVQVGTLLEMNGEYERALVVLTKLVEDWSQAGLTCNMSDLAGIQLASVKVRLGMIEEAAVEIQSRFREDTGAPHIAYAMDALMVAVRIAIAVDKPYQAALMQAAALNFATQNGFGGVWLARPDVAADRETIRRTVPVGDFDRAVAEGSAMTFEDLLGYAYRFTAWPNSNE